MRFYLGTHMPNWLALTETPLFVSRRRLAGRKTYPRSIGRWVLDSGGFTELHLHGEWKTSHDTYAAEATRYATEIGNLDWVAPMDWMCEPSVIKKTGLTVEDHQRKTIESYKRLYQSLGPLVVPVIQGWMLTDYERHVHAYDKAGIILETLPIVGVGSICRRGADGEIAGIIRKLQPIACHAFGVRGTALQSLGDVLASADSMAWSSRGRHDRLPGCQHQSCANCLIYAERWHQRTMTKLGQQRLEIQ